MTQKYICFHVINRKKGHEKYEASASVPEVRVGSSWGGWEGEEEGEELHRCSPDWECRRVSFHPSTDSSHERTARRALQSGGPHTRTAINTHTHTINTRWYRSYQTIQWYILWSMAVRERQATSVELCKIQMSTEPPERDTHMETEIKTQTETCMYVRLNWFFVLKTSCCVCVLPAAVGAERESPAAEPGSLLAADCPEGCTQQGFHQGWGKAYLRGQRVEYDTCMCCVCNLTTVCVCYVPVCGFTNMLPGGIPFSMM